jgi:hypothetical protein
MKRRRRRSIFDIFDFSPFEEFEKIFEGFPKLPGTGYSITVTQSGGKTIVHAKVGRDVDVGKLREELRRQYPSAQIVIEGGKPLIEEVREEAEPSRKKKHVLIEEIKEES